MALTEDEARQVFAALSERARDVGLAWVIEQVTAAIAYGNPQEFNETELRRVARGAEDVTAVAPSRVQTGQRLTRTVPYTPQERLQILARALLRSVVESHSVELELVSYAAAHNRHRIQFDTEDDSTPGFAVTENAARTRTDPNHKLKAQLMELLSAIDAP